MTGTQSDVSRRVNGIFFIVRGLLFSVRGLAGVRY